MKKSTADRVRDFVVRNFAWIVIAQFVIMLTILAVGGTVLMMTLRNLTVVGNQQLLANRAVVRCSLEQTLEFDEYLARRLGIPITVQPPNTAGIDCEAILRTELPPLDPANLPHPREET